MEPGAHSQSNMCINGKEAAQVPKYGMRTHTRSGKAFQLVHRFACRVRAQTSEERYEGGESFVFR